MLQSYIQENKLEKNIALKGFCSMDKVANFYRKADVFLLPSFSDPSPLSVVEAICCKLPLLISNRCGNHYEALDESMNGYSFDPDNHIAVRKSYERLLSRQKDWEKMGIHSRILFEKNFQQVVVLNSFIQQLEMKNRD